MSAEQPPQLQLVSMQELEAMGWRPGRHLSTVGPSGAGKTPAGDLLPELRLRLHPEPPEAA